MKSKPLPKSYTEQNLQCARIIARDPQRYSGPMQTWASMILK